MRITSEMMVQSSMRRLSTRLERYERAQSELASGRRIMKPSDDPGNAGRAMTLRARMRAHEQEQRNITDATAWLQTTDSHLQTAITRLHRARDLAVRGSNSLSQTERQALQVEIDAIRQELVSVANASYRGRPLFGGFQADEPVTETATGWTVASNGAAKRRIGANETVGVNVLATDAFVFTAADGSSQNVFALLGQISQDLATGDAGAVGAAIEDIDAARDQIGSQLASVGSNMNRVESASRRSSDMELTLRTELSEVEDVDVAEAIMELQLQQVAYESTLGALGKALPQTLVAFLR